MKKMSLLAIGLLVFSGWIIPPRGLTAEMKFIRIATGTPGGLWYAYGAKISEIANQRIKGINASVTSGGGVVNCKTSDKNEIQLGMTYGVTAFLAIHGKAPFDKKYENVRALGGFDMSYFHSVVRKDSYIKSYEDLKDKRIVPGAPGQFSRATTEIVLKAYDLNFDKIRANGGTVSNVTWDDAVEMMKDKNVDYIGYLVGIPVPSILGLSTMTPVRLLSIGKEYQTKLKDEGYLFMPIPAGMYRGEDTDKVTLATPGMFIVNKDVPDDIVYQLTKIIYEDLPKYKDSFKQFGKINVKMGHAAINIPVHPGAKKYFDEHLK